MQGASPSIKIASPSSSESDFSVVKKKCEEGGKNVPKMLENSVLDLVVSIFCPIFVVQNERETPLSFSTGTNAKSPARVSQRTTGQTFS